jgi:hypothetical protein
MWGTKPKYHIPSDPTTPEYPCLPSRDIFPKNNMSETRNIKYPALSQNIPQSINNLPQRRLPILTVYIFAGSDIYRSNIRGLQSTTDKYIPQCPTVIFPIRIFPSRIFSIRACPSGYIRNIHDIKVSTPA